MKPAPFDYHKAGETSEVLDLLKRHGDDAKILAGGQSLLPSLNFRLSAPKLLIDINGLHELSAISLVDGHLRIGALARHFEIGESSLVREHAPLLTAAVPHIAHQGIRNRGTFGGNLATADPASEFPACAVALDGRINLLSTRQVRNVGARDFFQGTYDTLIEPDELLVSVDFPIGGTASRFGFKELMRRRGDYATAGLAATARVENSLLSDFRLVFFGVSTAPVLAAHSATAFNGRPIDQIAVDDAKTLLTSELHPIADVHTSAESKLHMCKVLLERVVRGMAES